MDEFSNHWYQAGSLFVQAGFLIAAVWSVRAILKNMRASQEQMGALLKLTLSVGASVEESQRTTTRLYPLGGWPEAAAQSVSATTATRSEGACKGVWSGVAEWLQAPMVSSGISPWRKAVRWLQAPAGS